MNSNSWNAIFDKYKIIEHDFDNKPYIINAEQIKQATTQFTKTNEREVRILCKQDSRENRPEIFIENNLFLLPVKNGEYAIVKGEGYIDIPEIQLFANYSILIVNGNNILRSRLKRFSLKNEKTIILFGSLNFKILMIITV
jgi:hypothetical protein